ncbi:DUF4041 domain-containing protein [Clostridium tagluense]|uniref:DUF4041 domain-containing protein n=1 Tax=Clostridium tagluense TaxID=360422 RepID=UPI001CF1E83E|nr:DUF4041 domain-containing protein [Clostridium tagluense]MCB2310842.1 DUF4041 domain-containing protein [Clostridium tagluense]MCB2315696.1 DUF4041 domain-containing protein [Clostridium tagluense]MCB2320660.1 DUF4041 domain-containing protein [Clostridium tagluense]MCB2325435.1 DUF4041 domain-containing protein [Clostridium tagluense]MCB2330288.1 DUF4041 domain-containing protein [Clostridium tagluense]
MAILTSIKDALNAQQYKSEIEKLIEENKNLRYIKLTPTQLGMSQVLAKTKELELEIEEYDKLIETKTKAIEELNREYKSQAGYQTKEFEEKSNEYDNLIRLKAKDFEDKSAEYDDLIRTKSEEYNSLMEVKSKELEDKKAQYDDLIGTKNQEYDNLIELKGKEMQDKSTEYNEFIERKNSEYEELTKQKAEEHKLKLNEYEVLMVSKIKSIDEINLEYSNLKTSVDSLKSEIITLDDDILMQSYGVYKPEYNLMNSIKGATMLQDLREKQRSMVKSKEAIEFKQWIVNGNIKEGNEVVDDMTEDMIKLVLRIFNDECDSIIDKVKFSNIEVIENRIKTFFEDLNKFSNLTQVKIVPKYLNTKLEELYVTYEYKLKQQEEKEEQNRTM